MENDELYIFNKCGKQNPFKVPDGYFDNLSAELMRHTEAAPKIVSLWQRYRLYVAAACVLAVVAGLATYFGFSSAEPAANPTIAATTNVANPDEAESEEYADYTMLDNDDIYSILASN